MIWNLKITLEIWYLKNPKIFKNNFPGCVFIGVGKDFSSFTQKYSEYQSWFTATASYAAKMFKGIVQESMKTSLPEGN